MRDFSEKEGKAKIKGHGRRERELTELRENLVAFNSDREAISGQRAVTSRWYCWPWSSVKSRCGCAGASVRGKWLD